MKEANHVAIIMDGNGRWARLQNKNRRQGHRQGVKVLEKIARAAADLDDINYLTVFAFSTENWRRPQKEVRFLFNLLRSTVRNELDKLQEEEEIKINFIGRLSELEEDIQKDIAHVEEISQNNKKLTLTVAVNYGGRAEIIDAVNSSLADKLSALKLKDREDWAKIIKDDPITATELEKKFYKPNLPDVDLLIRTGGEKRISNFLLWQISYAELFFTPVLWPDFTREHLIEALEDFANRQRKFGGLPGEER